ncbi:TIE1 [Branchiostoma lanceolatum]|uniref:receptor protein-tyrosine kinase n=1 Tax=Branchiostoma lanceolatum TaxID=7740 RepID=A0A8J9YWT8_BRALA|nr:TIE1 [Branchiostoma lanceolatum]
MRFQPNVSDSRTKMAAILTFIVTAYVMLQYNTADAAAVDVTLLSTKHFLDDSSLTEFLCRAQPGTITPQSAPGETPNTRPIIREGGPGPGNPFTVASSLRVPPQGVAYGARFMADAGNTRVGAFSCSVVQNGQTGKAVSFKIKDTAYVLPVAFTVRANIGESATLEVTKTSTWQQDWTDDQIRWSKDGQELQGQQGLQLTIPSVQTSDGGIYEAYRDGERNTWNHAFSRLIVRGKWGLPQCQSICPVCNNGGVCDPETGRCICTPGFFGTNCNSVCDAPHKFGQTCDHICDSKDCSGKLLCAADPFGCSCAASYRGIRCNERCSAGTFGAGCTQTCNCIGTCNTATGVCDAQGCSAGWSGPNCQEPAPVDVTLESSSHIVAGTATKLLCHTAGGTIRQTQSWPFRREGGAGPGNPFGISSTQPLMSEGVRYGASFMANAGNRRIGAFSCRVDSDGRSGSAGSFKVKDTAYLLPEAFTTTVSVGELVMLKMTKTSSWQTGWSDNQIKWSKDGQVLDNRQGLQLTIPSVQTSDGGIYEAYRDGERNTWNHAFSRLIVRACPTDKWGPDCRNRCPVCYNGGVCHVGTGKCVCAPGFRGDSCQSVCNSPQNFGSTCQATCDGGSCQGKLLCPADPFGCTCGPTYTGVRCDSACPTGTFGPGCTQSCHCKGTCTRATGVCDQQGCATGWSGTNCQVVSTNAVNFFATPVQDRVLNAYTAARHNNVDTAQCAKYCLQGTGLARGLRCKSFDMYRSGGTLQCLLNTENRDVQGSPGLLANNGGSYYQRGDLSPCSALPCANGATCLDRAGLQFTCICGPGWMGPKCDLASSNSLDYFAKYSGSNLEGNDAEMITGISRSNCSTQCLQGTETVSRGSCKSFDYRVSEQRCYLSTASKETNPQDFRQGNGDLEYYQREASGPCSTLPCQLPQRCQTAPTASGYRCFCPNGRLGPNCDVEAQVDVGIESKNYLVDTSNVEMYCRTVRGNIIQNNISNVDYPIKREKSGKIDIGNPFNTSNFRTIYNYGVYLYEPAGDLRLGPFSCQVQQGGQVTKVVTLNMKKNAKVRPTVITQTVSVGESVTLSVTTDADVTDQLTWHRDGDLVIGVQTKEYTIDSVQRRHVGVYEVFQPGRYHSYEHAFMRLIVRGCTKDRWGPPDCLGFCPVCQNGGVCDDTTGACLCAPGFRGVTCETACPAGFFGPTCRSRCTFANCREKLICLPDPYGCSCAAGFKGLDCNQACDAGTFGPGCALTCNCQSGSCNSMTGSCANGCKQGWTGNSCQIASNNPLEYFSKQQENFLLDSTILQTFDTSLETCATQCVKSQGCKSFNYQRDTQHCWVNTKNAAEANLVPMGGRDYYQREDFGECSKVPCLNQGACSVSDTPPGYTCTCTPGLTGSICTEDVDECLINNGQCDDKCINIGRSFVCGCVEPNFVLGADRRTCLDQTVPTNIQIQQTGTQCTVTWDPPPESALQIQEYQVRATAQLPVRDNDVQESELDTITKDAGLTRTASFQKSLPSASSPTDLEELKPNSVYPFRVRARSQNGWGGYSKEVNCTVLPLAVPFPPSAPAKNDEATGTANSDRTIPIWLYGDKQRYGSVGCYQVVVVELKNGATTSDLPNPQDLEVPSETDEYNAYVAAAHMGELVGRRKTVTLGDGQQTSCRPPQSRVRRALTNQDVFGTTFTNNPLNPSTPYTTSVRAFSPQGSQPPTYSSSAYMAPVTTAPPGGAAGTGPGTGALAPAVWGKIAAGIIGGALFLCALLPLLYYCWKKRGGGKKKDSFDVEGRMKGTGGVSAKADIPGVSTRADMPGVEAKLDKPGVQSSAGLSLHPGAPPVVKKPKDSAKASCFGKKKKETGGGGIEVYSPAIDARTGGELNAPSMNVRGPRANVDANAPHLEGDVDLRGPNVHMKKPKKSGGLNCLKKPKKPSGDIEMNAPGMNVRGPQADIDARASGELNAPSMNVRGPRANIDANAPHLEGDVDLRGPNVHMKKPKKSGGLNCLKKPKKPKGGIEMDMPDIKGNVSGPKMPDVDVKGPQMKVKGPEMPDVHLKGPKAPDVHLKGPKLKGPDVDINAPKVPTVNLKSGDIDIDHEYENMDFNLEGPKAKGGFKMPDLNIGKPNMPDFNLKGPKVKGPDVDIDANLDADVDLPEAKGGFKMPGFNMGKPNMPDFNLKGPKVKGPDVDIDANLPSANIDGDVDLPEAKGGFKMPGFNMGKPTMPDFNLKGPKVKGPDVDIDANLPSANIDADVDLPEAEGGFKMPGFNMGKPKMPDFNLKGPKVKGPDVDLDMDANIDADVDLPEAEGGFKMPGFNIGKPKMPDFNLKGPKVKGPDVDIDANLPSANIDGDVDLPDAEGGFKMPGFNMGKPDFSMKRPDMPDFNLPSFKGPQMKGPGVDIDAELPSGSIDADMSFSKPDLDLEAPKMPGVNVRGPKGGVNVNAPGIETELPRGKAEFGIKGPQAPKLHAQGPSFDVKGPKAPSMDIRGPRVKGGIDVDSPKVDLKGRPLDAEKGGCFGGKKKPSGGVDVDLKGPKLKGPKLTTGDASFSMDNPAFDSDIPNKVISWEGVRLDPKVLGRGKFGEVRKGTVKKGGLMKPAVVKMLKASAPQKDRNDFISELDEMTRVGDHPNLVNLIGAGQHDGNMFMALELANKGTLRSYLRESRPGEAGGQISTLSSKQLLQFSKEVAEGMQQISRKGIIHRDLSAKNVLVMQEGSRPVCKVSDYGLPRMVKAEKRVVPNRWMAPESLTNNTYTAKTDVWSYGVVLWEITTLGGTPYSDLENEELTSEIPAGYKLKQPNNCHDHMYILMRQCYRDDPETRPTFPQLAETLKEMEANSNETYIDVQADDSFEYEPADPLKDDDCVYI